MKTVLIPTDFNPESLKIIDSLVAANQDQIQIILLHAFKLSDSISDLLMLSRRTRDYTNISEEFSARLDHYQAKYSTQIATIGIEYFYGTTVVTFKDLLQTLNISFIAYLKNYTFNPVNKYSINPKYLTERCGCAVIEFDVNELSKENLFDSKMPQELAEVLSN